MRATVSATEKIAELERRVQRLEAALTRIADPTELTGDGITEEMVGPGAREMRARMRIASDALGEK